MTGHDPHHRSRRKKNKQKKSKKNPKRIVNDCASFSFSLLSSLSLVSWFHLPAPPPGPFVSSSNWISAAIGQSRPSRHRPRTEPNEVLYSISIDDDDNDDDKYDDDDDAVPRMKREN